MVRHSIFLMMILILSHGLQACSSKKFNADKSNDNITIPTDPTDGVIGSGFSQNPLGKSFSNIFGEQSRFSGVSRVAGRVSSIDADQEKEVWSKKVSGSYVASFGLSQVDGVVLRNSGEIKVVATDGEKSFATEFALSGYWALADQELAMAFTGKNAASVTVIRHLGSQWDNQSLEVAATMAEQFGYLFPLLSGDGTILVLFNPVNGSYAAYRAENDRASMGEAYLTCVSTETFAETQYWSSGAVSKAEDRLIVAKGTQVLHTIDISDGAACIQPSAWTTVAPQNVDTISRIGILANGTLWSLQNHNDDAIVEFYTVNQATVTSQGTFSISSKNPVALTQINDEHFAITNNIRGDAVLVVFSRESGDEFPEFSSTLKNLSSVAIDPSRLKFFEFIDSGSGHLRVTDMTTGESRIRAGLFLENILDKL